MNDAAKVALGAIGGVLALLLVLVLFGGTGMGAMMQGFGNGDMMDGGGFGLWWIFAPLFWLGLLVLLVWAVARTFSAGRSGGEDRRDAAEDIVRERFARGEIDLEEYERTREILRGEPAPKAEKIG